MDWAEAIHDGERVLDELTLKLADASAEGSRRQLQQQHLDRRRSTEQRVLGGVLRAYPATADRVVVSSIARLDSRVIRDDNADA